MSCATTLVYCWHSWTILISHLENTGKHCALPKMALLIASVVLIIMMTTVAGWHLGSRHRQQSLTRSHRGDPKAAAANTGTNATEHGMTKADGPRPKITIGPLADFDWSNTPPMKLRPFKPTYYITMGGWGSHPTAPRKDH